MDGISTGFLCADSLAMTHLLLSIREAAAGIRHRPATCRFHSPGNSSVYHSGCFSKGSMLRIIAMIHYSSWRTGRVIFLILIFNLGRWSDTVFAASSCLAGGTKVGGTL